QELFGAKVEEIARDMLRENLAMLLPDLIEKAILEEIQRIKNGP
ncbi:MAG: DUF2497 domain-containing protein, partial [Magnetococcales bacterium]|nr:DUF2497 domain-containing protein [Magnetococcales bacterium]